MKHLFPTARDGNTYAFRSRDIYKLTPDGGISQGFPKRTNSVFEKAPINIDAAAYSPWSRKTYMFKGGLTVQYSNGDVSYQHNLI